MMDRINIDENCFCFSRNGQELQEWFCEREVLKDGMRGNWLLMRRTVAGLLIADRDQYSNDIIERLDMFPNDPENENPYGTRFKRVCTMSEYLDGWPDWVADLEFQFEGTWIAEYSAVEGIATLYKEA